jgi:hypothetical protein
MHNNITFSSLFFHAMRAIYILSFILFSLTTIGQTWQQAQKLFASDKTNQMSLGSDIAVYGDYAVVGALRESRDVEWKQL